MAYSDVTQAFEILLEELARMLTGVRSEAAEAAREGKYDRAQILLQQAQRIDQFAHSIRQKQQEWGRVVGGRRRTRKAKRAPRGERTPGETYCVPILQALIKLGGQAKVTDVLERVYEQMRAKLKPVDLEPLPSNAKTLRWQNAAQWERLRMVKQGLLFMILHVACGRSRLPVAIT